MRAMALFAVIIYAIKISTTASMCVDKSNPFAGVKTCDEISDRCNEIEMRNMCPVTCGTCTTTRATRTLTECSDHLKEFKLNSNRKAKNCKGWKNYCRKNGKPAAKVNRLCPVTCNTCPCEDLAGKIPVFQQGKRTCKWLMKQETKKRDTLCERNKSPQEHCPETCQLCSSNPQRDALIDLYDKTQGVNWSNKKNWLTEKSECEWYGVFCDNQDSVYKLSLHENGLSGSIPSEVRKLPWLITLSLYENELSGSIPNEIGLLSRLETLSLGSNKLSGTIPSEIGQLTSLKSLDISNNEISGSIPSEIGKLTKSSELILTSNKLSGSMPSMIGQLTKLTLLSITFNELSGTIPNEIGRLTRLDNLYLGYNALTGSIPKEVEKLTKLEWCYLNYNKLSGSIPSEIGQPIELKRLKLNSNYLSGSIPNEIGQLTQLSELNLKGNNVSGRLNSRLCELPSLSYYADPPNECDNSSD